MEFCGCAMLALVTHSSTTGGWEYAMAYTVIYLIHDSQFNRRFHGNPAFTFATWLSESKLSCFDVFKQVMFQIFGYSFGFWLGGFIGLTGNKATGAATESVFSELLFNEIISVGVMVWLYLHAHDSRHNAKWNDFIGFAVGACIWFGYQLKLGNAHLNSAVLAGEDFGKSIGAWRAPGWGMNDFALFFAPLVSVFMTSLVYSFYHGKK